MCRPLNITSWFNQQGTVAVRLLSQAKVKILKIHHG